MRIRLGALALLLITPAALWAQTPASRLRHIVVIFQENVSFDHYFATYPRAQNPPGEPAFQALPHTPRVEGLRGALLTANPNARNPENGEDAVNPFRLDRSQAATADQSHAYRAEQQAFDHGKMDLFPKYTGRRGPPPQAAGEPGASGAVLGKGLTMGYFDGNTVTALWNYAQRYAMSQRFFGSTFGPSTPGALNLASGQTNGVAETVNGQAGIIDGGAGSLTDISDSDPLHDVCSRSVGTNFSMGGPNIGDLLNAHNLTWGWFQGGFDLELVNPNGTTGCARSHHSDVTGFNPRDYVPHHEPFQYYASTANPRHLRPNSVETIGHANDPANHQYDIADFFSAIAAGNFPAVSFLKAPAYENGHAGNSDPLDEQRFLVQVINFLQQQPEWSSTAVIVTYDDSDGWYDHVKSPLVNPSHGSSDAYSGPEQCGQGKPRLAGIAEGNPHALGRCGYGPRLPLLVISPWARSNYVARNTTDQTSVLRLIEDTFLNGQRLGQGSFDAISGSLDPLFNFRPALPPNASRLLLDETTGEPQTDSNLPHR